MTTMQWQWAASNMQNSCKRCTTHLSQQSTYVDSIGRSRRENETISGGGGRQKRVKVDMIEWRSLHLPLPSINSKPFHPATPVQKKDWNLFLMCPGSLGCAFRFVFRFLPGVNFRNPRNSAAFPDSVGTHVGIKSFPGKINLVQNSRLRNSGRNSGGKDT